MLPVENINNATFYLEKKTDVTFPRKGDKKATSPQVAKLYQPEYIINYQMLALKQKTAPCFSRQNVSQIHTHKKYSLLKTFQVLISTGKKSECTVPYEYVRTGYSQYYLLD